MNAPAALVRQHLIDPARSNKGARPLADPPIQLEVLP
jgi:hypothetical protein